MENKPSTANCLKAAKKWRNKYWIYRTKWELFKRQQNEVAASAIYHKMVIAFNQESRRAGSLRRFYYATRTFYRIIKSLQH